MRLNCLPCSSYQMWWPPHSDCITFINVEKLYSMTLQSTVLPVIWNRLDSENGLPALSYLPPIAQKFSSDTSKTCWSNGSGTQCVSFQFSRNPDTAVSQFCSVTFWLSRYADVAKFYAFSNILFDIFKTCFWSEIQTLAKLFVEIVMYFVVM